MCFIFCCFSCFRGLLEDWLQRLHISQVYRRCIYMYGGSNKHCYETTDLSHGIAATSVRLSGRWRRGLIVTACGAPGQRLWQVSPLLYTPRVGLASVHWQPVSRPLWQRWPWKRAVTWARLCVWLSSAAQLSATASHPAAHCYSALSRVAGFPAISSSTPLQPTLLDLTVARGERVLTNSLRVRRSCSSVESEEKDKAIERVGHCDQHNYHPTFPTVRVEVLGTVNVEQLVALSMKPADPQKLLITAWS